MSYSISNISESRIHVAGTTVSGKYSSNLLYTLQEGGKIYKVTRRIFSASPLISIKRYYRTKSLNLIATHSEAVDHKLAVKRPHYRVALSKILVPPPKPTPAPVNPLLPTILIMQKQIADLTTEISRLNQALVKANANITLLSGELAKTQSNLAKTQAALNALLK